MTQLTQGMYGRIGQPGGSDLFGIHVRQTRPTEDRMGKNGGWYNGAGEWLGMGDLSSEDLRRISAELENRELFVILLEQDSGVSFQTAPGPDYVAAHCNYIVAQHQVWSVTDEDNPRFIPQDFSIAGLPVKVLSRDEAKVLITAD